jgi:hypothetical protein
MRRARFVIYVVMLLLAAPAAQGNAGEPQRGRVRQEEQTSFNVEEPVRSPVPLPEGVLGILARDESVRACYAHEDEGAFAIKGWFRAAAVNLGGASGRRGYVVLPKEGCLLGNIGTFWVFAPEGRGYRLVLKTHALALSLGRVRPRGLRAIEISAASGVYVFEAVYEYDGTRYVPRSCRRSSTEEERKFGPRPVHLLYLRRRGEAVLNAQARTLSNDTSRPAQTFWKRRRRSLRRTSRPTLRRRRRGVRSVRRARSRST